MNRQAAVAAAARAELARRSLVDFSEAVVADYQRARHLDLIADYLERLESRSITRLIIEAPPQHGKSLSVSQVLPAWWLGRRPSEQIILASYGQELADRNSRLARSFVQHESYPFAVRVADDSSAVSRWHTSQGGGCLAAGTGSGLTGWPAHLVVIDDPVADAEQAASPTALAKVAEWFATVALTRLRPDGCVVVMQTRWSQRDLVGTILDGPDADEWTRLRLPALSEGDGDPLGRVEGEALWPEKYPAEVIESRRVALGSRAFAALYQQAPTSSEGTTFKRDWLGGTYDALPDQLHVVTAVDSSYGEGESDWSAIVTVGSDRRHFFVLDAQRGRWTFPELLRHLRAVRDEWKPSALLIEDTGSGKSAKQSLQAEGFEIVGVSHGGRSKRARAEAVTPSFESGRVLFPSASPTWKGELIEELASFPGGKHDDATDALVYALARLRATGRSSFGEATRVQHGHEIAAATPDPRADVSGAATRDLAFEEWDRGHHSSPRGACFVGDALRAAGLEAECRLLGPSSRLCQAHLRAAARREAFVQLAA